MRKQADWKNKRWGLQKCLLSLLLLMGGMASSQAQSISGVVQKTTCGNAFDGAINITLSGFGANTQFAWTGPNGFSATSEDVQNLERGTYAVTATNGSTQANASFSVTTQDNINPTIVTYDTVDIALGPNGTYTLNFWDFVDTAYDNCAIDDVRAKFDTSNYNLNNLGADCGEIGRYHRIRLQAFDHAGRSSTALTWANFVDVTPPKIELYSRVYLQLDENGITILHKDILDSFTRDACTGRQLDWVLRERNFDCTDIPSVVAEFRVVDSFGNKAGDSFYTDVQNSYKRILKVSSSTWTKHVVNIDDNLSPTPVCIADTTIYLDAFGFADLAPEDLDAGSFDNCQMASSCFFLETDTFDCNSVGTYTYDLFVFDKVGNSACCPVDVTVADTTMPDLRCKDTTLALDTTGIIELTLADIDDGTVENCSFDMVQFDNPILDCSMLGVNPVQLTVLDKSGATLSCNAQITLVDDLDPVAQCQNFTITLTDGNGYTLQPEDIDNGSYDNCAIVNTTLSKIDFTCSDIGTHTVTMTVYDAAGNSDMCQATVTVEDADSPTVNCQNITVQLDQNGEATISANDIDNGSFAGCSGIASKTISKTDFDCSDIGVQMVTLTVTDGNGNSSQCQAQVTIEPADLTVQYSAQDVSCAGATDGSIDVTATNSCSGSFQYYWSNNATTEDLNNIGPGNYSLTVVDQFGDSVSIAVTIAEPNGITASVTSVNISCGNQSNPVCDGEIQIINIAGGTAPYSVTWNHNANGTQLQNLCAGTYYYTIEDANGCSITDSVNLTEPDELDATVTTTNIGCAGGNVGAVSVDVSGGTAPYSYQWASDDNATSNQITQLAAGQYTVTITDANGCTKVITATVTEDSEPEVMLYTVDGNCTQGDLSVTRGFNVFVQEDATLSTNETEGSVAMGGDLTINGQYTVAGHSAGSFTDNSTNDNNPTALYVGGRIHYNNGGINVVNNGFVKICDLTGSNVHDWDVQNNQPMNTRISAGGMNSNPRINLSTHQSASSVNSCPLDIASAFSTLRNTSMAFANCTTNVTLLPSDPNNPSASPWRKKMTLNSGKNVLNLTWSELNALSEIIFNNQPSASRTLVINVDASGTRTWNAPQFAGIGDQHGAYIVWNFHNTTTLNMTGSRAIYGTVLAPYAHVDDNNQNNINGQLIAKSLIHRGGEMHDYFYAGDDSGCGSSCLVELDNNDDITLCAGESVTIGASAGNGVSYSWNTNETDSVITVSTSGEYEVTIDNGNCPVKRTINVQVSNLAVSFSTTDPNCNAGNSGTISTTVNGGVTPYTYQWSTNDTTANLTGLSEGTYYVTITDAAGCTYLDTVTLLAPPCCNITNGGMIAGDQANCGPFDPQAITSVTLPSGGLGNIEYIWMQSDTNVVNVVGNPYWQPVPNSNSPTLDPGVITETTYFIRCARRNGCNIYIGESNVVTISVNEEPSASLTVQDVTCAGPTQCADPYSFQSFANPTIGQSEFNNLYFSAEGRGGNNATNGTFEMDIHNVSPYSIHGSQQFVWPNGNSVPFTVSYDPNASGNNKFVYTLGSGNNQKTLKLDPANAGYPNNINGFYLYMRVEAGATLLIENLEINNDAVGQDFGHQNPTSTAQENVVFKGSDLASAFTITGDVTMAWSGSIPQQSRLNFNFKLGNIDCASTSCDGAVTANITGGTSPYSFEWSNGATTQNINNVCANTYSLIVTDAYGCDDTVTATVNAPDPLVLSDSTIENASCYGAEDGALSVSISGGTAPYIYHWNTGSSASSINQLAAGTYSVTVTDDNGCELTRNFTITEPSEIEANYTVQDLICVGEGGNGGSGSGGSGGNTGSSQPCDCNGRMQNFVVVYSGSNNASVVVSSGSNQNSSTSHGTISGINDGDTIIFTGNWQGGRLGPKTYLTIGGNTYEVHTSCSEDIMGDTYGPFTVVGYTDGDGNTCNGNNNTSNNNNNGGSTSNNTGGGSSSQPCDCDGRMQNFVVVYSGSNNASVQVSSGPTQNNSTSHGTISGVDDGDTITFTGNWQGGRLGPKTYLTINGNTYDIHTSCSIDILGDTYGPFTVIGYTDGDGNVCNGGSNNNGGNNGGSGGNGPLVCNGSASVTVTGGEGPYTIEWSNGDSGTSADSLCAGDYVVTITDANGCVRYDTVTVDEATGISLNASVNNISCHDCVTNSVCDINFSNLTPGEIITNQYQNQGVFITSQSNNNNVLHNNLIVFDTDATGTADPDLELNQGNVLIFAENMHDANNDGYIDDPDDDLYGGTVTLTFTSPRDVISFDFLDKEGTPDGWAKTYDDQHNLIDSVGIPHSGNATVQTITLNSQDVSELVLWFYDSGAFGNFKFNCPTASACNGSIDLDPSNGVSPYTYAWSTGATTEDLNGLEPGTYDVVVTDANGCIEAASFTITEPDELTSSTSADSVSCTGAQTGEATVVANGGTPTYSYVWTDGINTVSTNSTAQNLAAGTYYVTITDANGCSTHDSVVIYQPENIVVTESITDASCADAEDGGVQLVVNGGSPQLSGNCDCEGRMQNFVVRYTGSNNASVQVSSGPTQGNSTNHGSITGIDDGDDVTISGNWQGGRLGPKTYLTIGGNTYDIHTSCSEDIMGDVYGPFTVVGYTDGDGNVCSGNATVAGTQVWLEDFEDLNIGDDDDNGSTSWSVSTFNGNDWAEVLSTNGSQQFGAEDGDAKWYSDVINIANAGPVDLSVDVYSIQNGNLESSGSVVDFVKTYYRVNGGSWTLFDTNGELYGQLNANGETATEEDITGNTLEIKVWIHTTSSNEEYYFDNVLVSKLASGNYTYSWSNGDTTQNLTGVEAGTYSVTITDDNGCQVTETYTVGAPNAINVNGQVDDVTCSNSGNSQDITVVNYNSNRAFWLPGLANGNEPNWSLANGQLTQYPNGTAHLTGSITNNLYSSKQFDVSLWFTNKSDWTSWNNQGKTWKGNSGIVGNNYQDWTYYDFDDNQQNVLVGKGSYQGFTVSLTQKPSNKSMGLQIGDAANDKDADFGMSTWFYYTGTFNGQQYSGHGDINADASITQGSCNGAIDMTFTGGTAPYSYSWSNGASSEDINNLCAGTYQVTVTDANGCTGTKSFSVGTLSPMVASLQVTQSNCGGGSVDVSVSGGATPYTYQWSGPNSFSSSQEDIVVSQAGLYIITVTDANGCTEIASAYIQHSANFSVTVNTQDVSCYGNNDGTATAVVSGGSAPYTYAWSNSNQTGSQLTAMSAGNFTLTVTDNNGCSIVESFNITEPNQLQLSMSTPVHHNGYNVSTQGGSDGSINASVSGGTSPYSYTWSGGQKVKNLSRAVSHDDDDAEEDHNGSVDLSSDDLELVYNSGGNQVIGVRFTNIGIPQGATIVDAYIQFTSEENNETGTTQLVIKGEAAHNSARFSNSNDNISDRTTTSASVSWNPPSWNQKNRDNGDQLTPDLKNVVQEIVGLNNWSSGGALTFIISGSGLRSAYAHDKANGNKAPVLYVRYAENPQGSNPQNLEAGKYVLTVEDGNGCSIKDSVELDEPYGSQPFSEEPSFGEGVVTQNADGMLITMTPNPAVEQANVQVELEKASTAEVVITDMSGKDLMVIYNGSLAEGTTQIATNVGRLSAGMYQVCVKLSDGSMKYQRFVVAR